ncbi:MAG: hypothetical protein WEB52_06520 [Dehalococcoidia bacterium]
MKNFFKKDQPDERALELPLREAREFVPSSAQSPDARRFSLFNPEEEIDESNDEDLVFLASLVDATNAPVKKPEAQPQPAEQRMDDMEVFRESAALRQRTEIAKQLKVDNVDMGDLLEDLQTTRAALQHRRKAA